MNIDNELFKLVLKRNIYDVDPSLKALYAYEYFAYRINKEIMSIPRNEVIAIRGNGLHTQELFKCLSEDNKKRISFLIDKDFGFVPDNCDIPIILPRDMSNHSIDVIILSSYKWRNDFIVEDYAFMTSVYLIDPYELTEQDGLFFEEEFYKYPSRTQKKITYLDTSILFKRYKHETDALRKEYILRKLIAYLIEIKDFVNAWDMMDEYINSEYKYHEQIRLFKDETSGLINQISEIVKSRNKREIMVNWIDCCHKMELEKTPFGKACKDSMYYFDNAFTNSPWTHDVMNMIMFGKLPISGQTYIPEKFSDNCSFIATMHDNEYRFRYFANPGMYQGFFNDRTIPYQHPQGFEGKILGSRDGADCSTRLFWKSLKERVNYSEKQLHLIHMLAESHPPHWYSLCESINDENIQLEYIKDKALEFVSKQLLWQGQFDTDKTIHVYFSDHGEAGCKPYSDIMTHIFFAISGLEKVGCEKRLFSLLHLGTLIRNICTEGETASLDEIFKDYVLYENIDYKHKESLIKSIILPSMVLNAPPWVRGLQCRAIRSNEDLYAHYAYKNMECYFRLPDEDTNLINDERFKERIEELRTICGDTFVDIDKSPFFQDSHLLYDYLRLFPAEIIKW